MFLRKHLQTVALITRVPALVYRIRRYFRLGPRPLLPALREAGLGQADVVLALLKIGTAKARSIAEAIIRRPITVGPACLFLYNFNRQQPTVSRQPVITWVCKHNPCRQSTRIGQSFAEFRVGRTREQLRMRGVSRGDIKRALRRGWIQMAGV